MSEEENMNEKSLYELSGFKKAFEEVDKMKEEEKKKKEEEFWKDVEDDELKTAKIINKYKIDEDIDPFWLT